MPLLSSEVLLKLPAYLQERPDVNSSQVGKRQIMQGSGYLPISRKAAGPHSYLFPTATALLILTLTQNMTSPVTCCKLFVWSLELL